MEQQQKEMELANGKVNLNYEICPTYPVQGEIFNGFEALVSSVLGGLPLCLLDGYIGVDWHTVVSNLEASFKRLGKEVHFVSVESALLPTSNIEVKVAPFLGGDDPIFGIKTSLSLVDFFDGDRLKSLIYKGGAQQIIVYGCGAALCDPTAPIVYVDLPKNIIQKRMRGGLVRNLGAQRLQDNKQTYKRFYFVDWVVLNKHKKAILPHISIMADQQESDTITWMYGDALRKTLEQMSQSFFRVRPWFEPGVWGGQWLKNHLPGLDPAVPNYAWSFEMIVPENGLVLTDGGNQLEVSFDQLMYQESENVLGRAHRRFGDEFPIRFDFLDTYEGGNLSIQCHPRSAYIRENFGESFTQDETYYIVDCEKDAEVYLGFQERIEPKRFKQALVQSFEKNEALNIEDYVQKFPAEKHGLYLIPNGTVHASGKNNLVLEISATPYIFTFKMYDWVRPDLEGNPRPLNIDRAFDNLDFSRKGQTVMDTLISKPVRQVLDEQSCLFHLPTHAEHFYTVDRYEFDDQVHILTHEQCHILMLVEGESIELTTSNGSKQVFNFVETFAIPAAAQGYSLRNLGKRKAKVVVAYVKDEAC
ncbi:class I mannose-6-phosphate isomerase [Olivibacter sp. CPCC 100613]|uniref:class I mannose-6-phosphate isomerase n=1 Tax=Olivibacter sp. CPCC 100613 TaxID=3079931 RepID=UPI002FF72E58